MAKAKHLAMASGYNAQTSPSGPFAAIENYATHKGPPTFWLNNQHIQGNLVIFFSQKHSKVRPQTETHFFPKIAKKFS